MNRASQHNSSRGDRFCPPAISPPCADGRANRRNDPTHPKLERHRKVTTDKTFADLGVPAPLVTVLGASGITHPFPIQAQTLPDILAGRDVLGRGKTGSGRRLSSQFHWPAGYPIAKDARHDRRVWCWPRELATQITATLKPLAA